MSLFKKKGEYKPIGKFTKAKRVGRKILIEMTINKDCPLNIADDFVKVLLSDDKKMQIKEK